MTMRGRPLTQENKPKFHWLHSALKSIFSEQHDGLHSLVSLVSLLIELLRICHKEFASIYFFFKIKAAPWKRVKKLK